MWIYFSKKVLYLNVQYSHTFFFFLWWKILFLYFTFSFEIIADLLLTDLVAQLVKNPPAIQETWVRSLGWEDTMEKGKATHSSILTWTIQSMELQRVGYD